MTEMSPTAAGRVAVVTGAGQGIGAAVARDLAARGYRVAVLDRNGAGAKEVARSIGDGAGVLAVEADVADAESMAAARAAVIDTFGGVDVLVNNAAIFSTLTMRPFEEIGLDEWDRVMAVNVRGPFLCARAFSPDLRASARGRIVNLTSGAVFMGRPGYLHYVASKSALIGLTRSLAREFGDSGVTVNAIAPGSTETEVPRDTVTPADVARIVAGQAIKRRQTAADLVGTVAFLAGAESDFVTGQTLVVDGGMVFQ
ncbi:SDR family NAD(P)-dependent oxidoreductase [Jiangella mangrovi]|uniref:3-oxoacyl-[acyl-carrier protein] reductase n=1 Tax=Jiangella mangrovi TaxID=1524084 RepID=A0A7W9LNB8_9ACTN|nr:glucose 1-dehydrogenase [Jiangella mangrovi]MBB5790079.1 3-oxoacyl-[acyl-carrier protein] reductase [Jiangella mangrovi]